MHIKDTIVKHQFLIRLTLTASMTSLILMSLFGFIMVKKSYRNVLEENERYYTQIVSSFKDNFLEQLTFMKNTAVKMEYEKRIVHSIIKAHPYNVIPAIEELYSYLRGVPSAEDLCLYFVGEDYVLSSFAKYKLKFYISHFSDNDANMIKKMEDMLSLKTDLSYVIISDFESNKNRNAKLLIGVPISKDGYIDSIAIFHITSGSFDTCFLGTMSQYDYGLMIYSSDGELIFNNTDIYDALEAESEFNDLIDSSSQTSMVLDYSGELFKVYKDKDDSTGLQFIITVPELKLEQTITAFYLQLRSTLYWIVVLFVLLLLVTVWLNYKPILKLIRQIPVSEKGERISDEITFIGDTLERFKNRNQSMRESLKIKNTLLTDIILKNLIEGRPVSDRMLKELDIDIRGNYFYILSVAGLDSISCGREKLIQDIYISCKIQVYIVDILYENYEFILCNLMNTDKKNHYNILSKLKDHLAPYADKNFKMGVGSLFSRPNEMRHSYLSALSAIEGANGDGKLIMFDVAVDSFGDVQKEYSELVLKFLQNIRQGDKDKAMSEFEAINTFIATNALSAVHERYMCYSVLNSYMNTIFKLGFSLEEKEATALLHFWNIDDLHKEMTSSINHFCSEISKNIELKNNEFAASIVQYVDNNFFDSDISLTQVADEFDISIYVLSRLFKKQSNIGFKKYIIQKRIALSKYLLLTTEKSIKEIAQLSGFVDASIFTKHFKQICGVTPHKFRMQ